MVCHFVLRLRRLNWGQRDGFLMRNHVWSMQNPEKKGSAHTVWMDCSDHGFWLGSGKEMEPSTRFGLSVLKAIPLSDIAMLFWRYRDSIKPSNWNLTEIAAAFPNVSSIFCIFVSCWSYWKCQVAKLMKTITLLLRPEYNKVSNKHISNGFLERFRENSLFPSVQWADHSKLRYNPWHQKTRLSYFSFTILLFWQ